MRNRPSQAEIVRLLTLIEEGLSLADDHALDEVGIALDTARVKVASLVDEMREGDRRSLEGFSPGVGPRSA